MPAESTPVLAAQSPQGVHNHPYVLRSITQTTAPVGSSEVSAEAEWYRYVIGQGDNQIVGYRHGSSESVRAAVDGIVEQLNARRTVKPGRKHITLGPSPKT